MKDLLLDLKLDEIDVNDQVLDSSGNNYNGLIYSGRPQIVDDDTFGHCLSFNGRDDSVALPPEVIPQGNEITVSFWANGGSFLPRESRIIYAISPNNVRSFSISLPWSNRRIYFECGDAPGGSLDNIQKLAQASDFKSKWTHWAFTKNAASGEMKIYLNGSLWHSGTGKRQPTIEAAMVILGSEYDSKRYYHGKIAHFHIYSKVLTPDHILLDLEQNLPQKNYLVKGTITDKNSGFGIPGLRVEVWDKDDNKEDDLCGSVLTNRQGNYKVDFDSSVFSGLNKDDRGQQRGLDLYLKVFDQNQLIKSTEQSVQQDLPAGEHELSLEVELPKTLPHKKPTTTTTPTVTLGKPTTTTTPTIASGKPTGMKLPIQASPIIRPTILYGNIGGAWF